LLIESLLWRAIVGLSTCTSPNYRKAMKAEHGRQIPRKFLARKHCALHQRRRYVSFLHFSSGC